MSKFRRQLMTGSMAEPVPPGPVLPYDAEVEWLQSDGTAYIDTGIKAAGNIYLKIHMVDYFSTSYGGKWAFGGRNGSNNKAFGLFINGNYYKIVFPYNNSAPEYDYATSYQLTCDVEVDNGTLKIGNKSHTYTKATFTSSYNVFLFGLNNGGTPIVSPDKIGPVYMSNGTTILDLIPVRKNGVGYFYDKTSGNLMGTPVGTFIIGSDVTT